MKEVYVLLADSDGTMRSNDEPIGVAVTSKEEAERYVREGTVGYSRSYRKLTIFDNMDEGIKYVYRCYGCKWLNLYEDNQEYGECTYPHGLMMFLKNRKRSVNDMKCSWKHVDELPLEYREQNFKTCMKKNWIIEENEDHILLFDQNNNLIGKFMGHYLLYQFLNRIEIESMF